LSWSMILSNNIDCVPSDMRFHEFEWNLVVVNVQWLFSDVSMSICLGPVGDHDGDQIRGSSVGWYCRRLIWKVVIHWLVWWSNQLFFMAVLVVLWVRVDNTWCPIFVGCNGLIFDALVIWWGFIDVWYILLWVGRCGNVIFCFGFCLGMDGSMIVVCLWLYVSNIYGL
jgi:hypothetical protein